MYPGTSFTTPAGVIRCAFEGCLHNAIAGCDYCRTHGGRKRCDVVGCTKFAQAPTTRCKAHGGGYRCRYPGCSKSAASGVFRCENHEEKPDIFTDAPPNTNKACQMSDCEEPGKRFTYLCKTHGGGKRCKQAGCSKSACGKTLYCVAHGGGKRCHFENCRKSAVGATDYCVQHGGGRRCALAHCNRSAKSNSVFCHSHQDQVRREKAAAAAVAAATAAVPPAAAGALVGFPPHLGMPPSYLGHDSTMNPYAAAAQAAFAQAAAAQAAAAQAQAAAAAYGAKLMDFKNSADPGAAAAAAAHQQALVSAYSAARYGAVPGTAYGHLAGLPGSSGAPPPYPNPYAPGFGAMPGLFPPPPHGLSAAAAAAAAAAGHSQVGATGENPSASTKHSFGGAEASAEVRNALISDPTRQQQSLGSIDVLGQNDLAWSSTTGESTSSSSAATLHQQRAAAAAVAGRGATIGAIQRGVLLGAHGRGAAPRGPLAFHQAYANELHRLQRPTLAQAQAAAKAAATSAMQAGMSPSLHGVPPMHPSAPESGTPMAVVPPPSSGVEQVAQQPIPLHHHQQQQQVVPSSAASNAYSDLSSTASNAPDQPAQQTQPIPAQQTQPNPTASNASELSSAASNASEPNPQQVAQSPAGLANAPSSNASEPPQHPGPAPQAPPSNPAPQAAPASNPAVAASNGPDGNTIQQPTTTQQPGTFPAAPAAPILNVPQNRTPIPPSLVPAAIPAETQAHVAPAATMYAPVASAGIPGNPMVNLAVNPANLPSNNPSSSATPTNHIASASAEPVQIKSEVTTIPAETSQVSPANGLNGGASTLQSDASSISATPQNEEAGVKTFSMKRSISESSNPSKVVDSLATSNKRQHTDNNI